MKKLIVLCLLLFGCQKPQYYLYVYYARTCPVCHSFINDVIPLLQKEYGNQMVITQLDIDEKSSRDDYQKTILLLEDYSVNDHTGSVPFIVLDGYFAKAGYKASQKDIIIEVIKKAIEGQQILSELNDIYQFKDGQYFHKEE